MRGGPLDLRGCARRAVLNSERRAGTEKSAPDLSGAPAFLRISCVRTIFFYMVTRAHALLKKRTPPRHPARVAGIAPPVIRKKPAFPSSGRNALPHRHPEEMRSPTVILSGAQRSRRISCKGKNERFASGERDLQNAKRKRIRVGRTAPASPKTERSAAEGSLARAKTSVSLRASAICKTQSANASA